MKRLFGIVALLLCIVFMENAFAAPQRIKCKAIGCLKTATFQTQSPHSNGTYAEEKTINGKKHIRYVSVWNWLYRCPSGHRFTVVGHTYSSWTVDGDAV